MFNLSSLGVLVRNLARCSLPSSRDWQELTNPLIPVPGKVSQIGFHAEKNTDHPRSVHHPPHISQQNISGSPHIRGAPFEVGFHDDPLVDRRSEKFEIIKNLGNHAQATDDPSTEMPHRLSRRVSLTKAGESVAPGFSVCGQQFFFLFSIARKPRAK